MRDFEQKTSRGEAAPHSGRLLSLGELAIPASYKDLAVPGVVLDPYIRERVLPDDGLVFVGMNSAAYAKVPNNRVGQVYTIGLAGCTGVAGVAQIKDGALAGISHYDALVDAQRRINGIGASERFMNQFTTVARACGARAIQFTIAYAELHRSDPNYGKFGDNYEDWHFVDQLESFAEEAEPDVTVELKPYKNMAGSTLAANVDRGSRVSVAFK